MATAHIQLVSIVPSTTWLDGATGSNGSFTAAAGANHSGWSIDDYAVVTSPSALYNTVYPGERVASESTEWVVTVRWVPDPDTPDPNVGYTVVADKFYKFLCRHGAFINSSSNYSTCSWGIDMESSAASTYGIADGTTGSLLDQVLEEYAAVDFPTGVDTSDISSTSGPWQSNGYQNVAAVYFPANQNRNDIRGTFTLNTVVEVSGTIDGSRTLPGGWSGNLFANGKTLSNDVLFPAAVFAGEHFKLTVTTVGGYTVE